MIQKPLLTMFLSLFHLIPLSDTIHIFLVKTVFSVFGVMALVYFSHFVLEITEFKHSKIQKPDLAALMALFLVAVSPLIRNNFFNIRSDQIAFFLFSLFLLFCGRKKMWPAVATLVLIPCFGIKEIIFLLPGALYFYWTFRSIFTQKMLVTICLSVLTVLVWIVALNMRSFFYLLESFVASDYYLRFGPAGILPESFTLLISLAAVVYILVFRLKNYYKLGALALFSVLIFLSFPQANTFFIASILPLAFLPLLAVLLDSQFKKVFKVLVAAVAFSASTGFTFYYRLPFYETNFAQLWFIELASKVVKSNAFSYLDGEGVLPRQHFHPCFVSPEDEAANGSCLKRMIEEKPDVIIITRRLFYLGEVVFKNVQAGYVQIYPNLWIRQEKMTDNLRSKVDLSAKKPLPIIIF